jgi:hypothetical protein
VLPSTGNTLLEEEITIFFTEGKLDPDGRVIPTGCEPLLDSTCQGRKEKVRSWSM